MQLSPGTLHFVQQERQLVVNNKAVVQLIPEAKLHELCPETTVLVPKNNGVSLFYYFFYFTCQVFIFIWGGGVLFCCLFFSESSPQTSLNRRSSGRQGGVHELSAFEQLVVELVRHDDSWPFMKLVSKIQVTHRTVEGMIMIENPVCCQ